jgi:hypothetical protein
LKQGHLTGPEPRHERTRTILGPEEWKKAVVTEIRVS